LTRVIVPWSVYGRYPDYSPQKESIEWSGVRDSVQANTFLALLSHLLDVGFHVSAKARDNSVYTYSRGTRTESYMGVLQVKILGRPSHPDIALLV
jgi:hypothetical protein